MKEAYLPSGIHVSGVGHADWRLSEAAGLDLAAGDRGPLIRPDAVNH